MRPRSGPAGESIMKHAVRHMPARVAVPSRCAVVALLVLFVGCSHSSDQAEPDGGDDSCAGIACDQPPAATCANAIEMTYATTGTCTNGACSYTPTSTDCIAPPHATAVCTSNACDFTCDAGYTKSGVACVSSDLAPSAIVVGARHACALLASGVWCWGYNGFGELGTGSTSPTIQMTPVAVTGLAAGVTAISVGGETSCAIVSGGVWCWGDDGEQQPAAARQPAPRRSQCRDCRRASRRSPSGYCRAARS